MSLFDTNVAPIWTACDTSDSFITPSMTPFITPFITPLWPVHDPFNALYDPYMNTSGAYMTPITPFMTPIWTLYDPLRPLHDPPMTRLWSPYDAYPIPIINLLPLYEPQ